MKMFRFKKVQVSLSMLCRILFLNHKMRNSGKVDHNKHNRTVLVEVNDGTILDLNFIVFLVFKHYYICYDVDVEQPSLLFYLVSNTIKKEKRAKTNYYQQKMQCKVITHGCKQIMQYFRHWRNRGSRIQTVFGRY